MCCGEEQNDNEQKPRNGNRRNGEQLEIIVTHFGNEQHGDNAHHGENQLAFEKVSAVAVLVIISVRIACREKHDKPYR